MKKFARMLFLFFYHDELIKASNYCRQSIRSDCPYQGNKLIGRVEGAIEIMEIMDLFKK